jgi:hypothetical protein
VAKRLAVWLTVSPEQEDAFNRWYQDEYIPRFTTQIPGIRSVSRWKVPGTTTYMTIYDLDPSLEQEQLMTALRNPDRDADRAEWNEWEHAYLSDFRDGFFEEVYSYQPE